ncbi:MAG: MraY family glycosyltransferase [Patescibacteria group bacterium]
MNDNDFIIYFGAILLSFLLAVGLTPLVKLVARRFDIMDKPQTAERKIHHNPVPFMGGWAIFLSVFVGVFVFQFFNLADFSLINDRLLWGIFISCLILMIGGTIDDKYSLKPEQQIFFPIIAVVVVLLSGLHITFITNPLSQSGAILFIGKYLGIAIVFFWLLGMAYTTKFLDGLDGLVAGIATIAALFIFLVSLRWDTALSATGIWALLLLGASLGFLIYNWRPASIFLGEGGSVFIGFLLGILSIVSGSKIITTLLVMGLPALDVLLVIVRRLISGKSPFAGDRNHLHYRLLNLGLSHTQAVWLLWLIALAFGSLGIISTSYGKMILIICLMLVMAIISTALWVKSKKS